MESPETENRCSEDEVLHIVTVSDFYMSIYELTQAEYQEIMEENPSAFSGRDLPVENVTWLDAIRYCNARSEKEGFELAYTIERQTVIWNRGADGCRLPAEAEWEYVCRAGTVYLLIRKLPSVRRQQSVRRCGRMAENKWNYRIGGI